MFVSDISVNLEIIQLLVDKVYFSSGMNSVHSNPEFTDKSC